MIRISQIKLKKDEPVSLLPEKIARKLGIRNFSPESWEIVKESVDARDKPQIRFVYTVDFSVKDEDKLLARFAKRKDVSLSKVPELKYEVPFVGRKPAGRVEGADCSNGRANMDDVGASDADNAAGSETAEKTDAVAAAEIAEGTETENLSDTWNVGDRPVVVGFGPCGMFAALILAEAGMCPVVLERGRDVDRRTKDVEHFWETGELDPASNVQFGEGGAGTFSDGKLTTGIKDVRISKVKEELIEAGADPAIAYRQMPHVGTDVLRTAVKNIRKKIISLGGEVKFESRVTGILIADSGSDVVDAEYEREESNRAEAGKKSEAGYSGSDSDAGAAEVKRGGVSVGQRKIAGLVVNEGKKLMCQNVVISPGNGARDTFRMLHAMGIRLEAKPFSVGVRIEHPQSMIDLAQYGMEPNDTEGRLGAASYKLSYRSSSGRGVYTFCMCPGGYVVGAASEPGCVVTNGMSYRDRAGKNANSALLADVRPEDFPGEGQDPLAGIRFQEELERRAYELGGGRFYAPVQRVGDFLGENNSSGDLPEKPAEVVSDKQSGDSSSSEFAKTSKTAVIPTYRPGVRWTSVAECLPGYVADALREALPEMAQKIRDFDMADAVITGVETRSSSPVRILRDKSFQSVSVRGLYPGGEGAGYAGGIISAAVDGIKIAEKIIGKFIE